MCSMYNHRCYGEHLEASLLAHTLHVHAKTMHHKTSLHTRSNNVIVTLYAPFQEVWRLAEL
jgi:hypothetical protein